MKVLYSLPHPGDSLSVERAGHIGRANALLRGLEELGHDVVRVEASGAKPALAAVSAYRRILKDRIPRAIALPLRDAGRVRHGKRHAARLIELTREHRPDIILETHLAFMLSGCLASKATGIPLVVEDIAPAWEEERVYGAGLKKTARQVYGRVTEQAGLLVAVNETIKSYLRQEGVAEKKIAVVENGIDSRFCAGAVDGARRRAEYGIGGDETAIVFVGSFQPYHRVDLLIEAFARIAPVGPAKLLLVGDSSLSERAKSLAKAHGIDDRTIFAGRVPSTDVASFVAAADICVMPATNDYGNPMKMYEYMALGKPVVAPDKPPIREIATHDVDALLFPQDDVAALSAALKALIDDGGLRQRLGARTRERVSDCTWLDRARALQDAIVRAGLVQG